MSEKMKDPRREAIAARAKCVRKEIDPKNPNMPFYTGFYEFAVELADGTTRRMMTYIPEGTLSSGSGIFLLPPSGVSIEDFLAESNWIDIADGEETKEKLTLFVLESGPNGWNTEEAYGDPTGDVAYIRAAYDIASQRVRSCVFEAMFYFVGYQDGGTLAQMAAMWEPAIYGGLAAVNSAPVPGAYMQQAQDDYLVNINGFDDPYHLKDIRKGEVPMPVWLIGAEWPDESPEACYWKRSCGCAANWKLFDRETHVYVREAETPYPQSQEKAAYRVWTSKIANASAELGRKLNRRIWKDFLYRVRRWRADPGGNLRIMRDPVRDLGMEYRYEMVDGYCREWYIHVPDVVKAQPEKPVPLVFAIHGYACSGEIYIGNSEWWRVADRYGFIVIFPTAVFGQMRISANLPQASVSAENAPWPMWSTTGREEGRPYEINFFAYMLEDICSRYAIDRTRVFATGHSNGSMMTQWLGLAKPEWFAAIAPCSGILHMINGARALETPEVAGRVQTELPIWMFGGMREEWLLDGSPELGNRTCASIHTWWDLNRMPGEKPTDFTERLITRERWHEWFYDKDGVPMVRYTGLDYFPHSTMPEMSFRIWEEFFSKFSRENGEIVYES